MKTKRDVGLMWAKFLATYNQLSVILGLYNTLSLFGIFYVTTAYAHVSLIVYISVTLGVFALLAWFVFKIGISGYYRFFNQQAMSDIDRKLNIIGEKLGIDFKKRL